MSQQNALQIVQNFCAVRGLTQPNSLLSATDPGIVQMKALLNEEVAALTIRYEWQQTCIYFTFNTIAQQNQGYVDGNVPGATSPFIAAGAGFWKITNDTLWDQSRRLTLFGPRKMQDIAMLLAIPVTGPFLQYNIWQNQLNIIPTPAAGDVIIGFYQSFNGWTATDGTTTSQFIADDTDVPLLDNQVIYLGLKWRWLKEKGLSYGEALEEYEMRVQNLMANNRPRTKKSLSGTTAGYFDPIVVMPAGSWPVQT